MKINRVLTQLPHGFARKGIASKVAETKIVDGAGNDGIGDTLLMAVQVATFTFPLRLGVFRHPTFQVSNPPGPQT